MRRASALAALLAAPLLLAAQTPSPREQLEQTQAALSAQKAEAAALARKQAQAQRDLEALRSALSELAERQQVSERRTSAEEQKLAAVNAELKDKQQAFDARKEEYARTLASLLRMRGLPATALFASPQDTQQLLRSASVLQLTNAALAEQAQSLRARLSALQTLRREALERTTRTQALKQELTRSQSALAAKLRERQRLEEKLNADAQDAQAQIAALTEQSATLQELIGRLEESPRPASRSEPGKLRAPVVGRIVHRFGEHKSGNESWRGMVLRTRPHAAVIAPAEAMVAFAGNFRDYGPMVILKQADGRISLIAGLGEIAVRLRQKLRAGEPLGRMPESVAPEAYLELRGTDAKPIDPGDGFANLVSE